MSSDVSTAPAPAPHPPGLTESRAEAGGSPGPSTSAAMHWIALLLVVAAASLAWRLLVPVVLAAWGASLARPIFSRLARVLGGRSGAAGAVVTALLLVVLLPVAVLVAAVASASADVARTLAGSSSGRAAVQQLLGALSPSSGGPTFTRLDVPQIVRLLEEHGARTWELGRALAGATATGALATLVFLVGVYTFLVDGPRAFAWTEARLPLPPNALRRLAAAFDETGRGLLVGAGLTAAAQALVATVAYAVVGVPRALILGALTLVAAFVPIVGAAVVWVPVAAGLALSGRPGAALAVALVGVLLISTIDNVLRPVFARWGRLDLPPYVLLLAMVGGLGVLGPTGVLLGPLVARLAFEAFELARSASGAPARASQSPRA